MSRNIRNENIVLAWNAAYSSQDVDCAMDFMSEDFLRFGDSNRWKPSGKLRWSFGQKPFFKAFPNWTWDLIDIRSEGEWVICEFIERGTWTEPYVLMSGETIPASVPMFVMEPTGQSYSDYNCDWFRVNNDGLIAELHAYVTNTLDRVCDLEGRINRYVADHLPAQG